MIRDLIYRVNREGSKIACDGVPKQSGVQMFIIVSVRICQVRRKGSFLSDFLTNLVHESTLECNTFFQVLFVPRELYTWLMPSGRRCYLYLLTVKQPSRLGDVWVCHQGLERRDFQVRVRR